MSPFNSSDTFIVPYATPTGIPNVCMLDSVLG